MPWSTSTTAIVFIYQIALPLLIAATDNTNSLSSESTDYTSGYVAEWEILEGVQPNVASSHGDIPPPRINPAVWYDSSGTWWIFGGQRPLANHTSTGSVANSTGSESASTGSDSEVVGSDSEVLGDLWALGNGGKWKPVFRPIRDTPNPLSSYPQNLRKIIMCGSVSSGHLAVFGGLEQEGSMTSADPLFDEDNTVWLYDIPSGIPNPSDSGLWTSYICCDACIPDQNTTLEFCPHFDEERAGQKHILWCSPDALMALNLNSRENGSRDSLKLDWWKFDLGVTEWVKLDPLKVTGSREVNFTAIFDPACITASDDDLAYILCPTTDSSGNSKSRREVYEIQSADNSIKWIATITLNSAFEELGQSGACVMAAVKVKGQTLLVVAYHKLVDFWIHDHSSGKVQPLENIWRGPSLDSFQHLTGFYHIVVSYSGENRTVYLVNPRHVTLTCDLDQSKTFLVRIQPDTTVFLPRRDIPPSHDSIPEIQSSLNVSNGGNSYSTIEAPNSNFPAQFASQSTSNITGSPQNSATVFAELEKFNPLITNISNFKLPADQNSSSINDVATANQKASDISAANQKTRDIPATNQEAGNFVAANQKKEIIDDVAAANQRKEIIVSTNHDKEPESASNISLEATISTLLNSKLISKINSKPKLNYVPINSSSNSNPIIPAKIFLNLPFPTIPVKVKRDQRQMLNSTAKLFFQAKSLSNSNLSAPTTQLSNWLSNNVTSNPTTVTPNFPAKNQSSIDPGISGTTASHNWLKDQKPSGERSLGRNEERKFFPRSNPSGIRTTTFSSPTTFSTESTSEWTSRIEEEENESSVGAEGRDKLNENRSNSRPALLLTKLNSNLNWTETSATQATREGQRLGAEFENKQVRREEFENTKVPNHLQEFETKKVPIRREEFEKKVPILLYFPHQSENKTENGQHQRSRDFVIVSGGRPLAGKNVNGEQIQNEVFPEF